MGLYKISFVLDKKAKPNTKKFYSDRLARGGADGFIDVYNLKNVDVYQKIEDVPEEREVDYNDDLARIPDLNFALLDNSKLNKERAKNERRKF